MDILERIVKRKREEVAKRMRATPVAALRPHPSGHVHDFRAALQRPRLGFITEIKRASPSKGTISPEIDVDRIARQYQAGGAAAISVLTDKDFFCGSDLDLRVVRRATTLPVLRKDFTIDEYQIHETRSFRVDADAVLLIVRILTNDELRRFIRLAKSLGLAALVETHDANEIDRALAAGADIIGVNARNLGNFEVDLERVINLRAMIPSGVIAVAESGINTRSDVVEVERAGYHAVLVGESLMRADDPFQKLRELRGETA